MKANQDNFKTVQRGFADDTVPCSFCLPSHAALCICLDHYKKKGCAAQGGPSPTDSDRVITRAAPSFAGGGSQPINALKKFNKTRENVQVYKTVLPFVYSHRSAAQFNSKTVSHHPIIAYFFHEKGVQGIALSQQPP
jgi:hypothetical protein